MLLKKSNLQIMRFISKLFLHFAISSNLFSYYDIYFYEFSFQIKLLEDLKAKNKNWLLFSKTTFFLSKMCENWEHVLKSGLAGYYLVCWVGRYLIIFSFLYDGLLFCGIFHLVRTQTVLSRCGTVLAVRIISERQALYPIAQVSLLSLFYTKEPGD